MHTPSHLAAARRDRPGAGWVAIVSCCIRVLVLDSLIAGLILAGALACGYEGHDAQSASPSVVTADR